MNLIFISTLYKWIWIRSNNKIYRTSTNPSSSCFPVAGWRRSRRRRSSTVRGRRRRSLSVWRLWGRSQSPWTCWTKRPTRTCCLNEAVNPVVFILCACKAELYMKRGSSCFVCMSVLCHVFWFIYHRRCKNRLIIWIHKTIKCKFFFMFEQKTCN